MFILLFSADRPILSVDRRSDLSSPVPAKLVQTGDIQGDGVHPNFNSLLQVLLDFIARQYFEELRLLDDMR